MSATTSLVPQLVAHASLTQANAARAFAGELADILGPPLGGLLISVGSLTLALGFDAGTFVVGALCLLAVRPRPMVKAQVKGESGYLHDLREGFRYVLSSTWLWVTILIFSVVNICVSGVTVVLLPLLAEARFAGASSLGWLLAGVAGGALVSSLVLNQLGRLRRRGLAAYLGVVMSGLALMGLAVAPTVVWGVLATALAGASMAVFGIIWETVMQELVPDDVLGRVVSIDMLGSFALLPLGFLLTGYLAEVVPLGQVALVYGGVTTLLTLVGLSVPAVRRLD